MKRQRKSSLVSRSVTSSRGLHTSILSGNPEQQRIHPLDEAGGVFERAALGKERLLVEERFAAIALIRVARPPPPAPGSSVR